MQSKENLKLKVGIFIIVAFSVIVGIIFLIGNERHLFSKQFSVYCSFTDISGLRIGAPVYLVGLNVGQVEDIYFSGELVDKSVTVKLSIDQKFEDRIRADSLASIQTEGLLGDKTIFISIGSAKERQLKDGDFIQTQEQASIATFLEKGETLLDNFNRATDHINKMLESLQGSDAQADLSATVKSLRNIFGEVEKGNGILHALIYENKEDKTVQNVTDMSAYLRDTAKNFRDVSEKIKAGEGTIGGLLADPTIYYDLKTLLDKANRNKLLKGIIRSTLKAKDEKLIGETKAN